MKVIGFIGGGEAAARCSGECDAIGGAVGEHCDSEAKRWGL